MSVAGVVGCQRPGCGKQWARDPVYDVACPTCHAPPGKPCKRPSGHGVWNALGRFCETRDKAADRAGAYGPCPLGLCGVAHNPNLYNQAQEELPL